MSQKTLSEVEMGEIALKYVRQKIRRDSISLDPEKLRREIGNTAKDLGITPQKATQFVRQMLANAFEAVLTGLDK